MSDLDYAKMPFRCFPDAWAPVIRQLLSDIAATLTPAQQAAFRLTDAKESRGYLCVYWMLDEECEPLDAEADDAIEALIAAAGRQVRAAS